jgi:hypothetical protein
LDRVARLEQEFRRESLAAIPRGVIGDFDRPYTWRWDSGRFALPCGVGSTRQPAAQGRAPSVCAGGHSRASDLGSSPVWHAMVGHSIGASVYVAGRGSGLATRPRAGASTQGGSGKPTVRAPPCACRAGWSPPRAAQATGYYPYCPKRTTPSSYTGLCRWSRSAASA